MIASISSRAHTEAKGQFREVKSEASLRSSLRRQRARPTFRRSRRRRLGTIIVSDEHRNRPRSRPASSSFGRCAHVPHHSGELHLQRGAVGAAPQRLHVFTRSSSAIAAAAARSRHAAGTQRAGRALADRRRERAAGVLKWVRAEGAAARRRRTERERVHRSARRREAIVRNRALLEGRLSPGNRDAVVQHKGSSRAGAHNEGQRGDGPRGGAASHALLHDPPRNHVWDRRGRASFTRRRIPSPATTISRSSSARPSISGSSCARSTRRRTR